MKSRMKRLSNNSLNGGFIFIAFVLFTACGGEEVHQPKPVGYNRIDTPKREYRPLEEGHPFTFQYSKYAEVKPHVSAISEPHWLDMYYPSFDAMVEITYKPLKGKGAELNEHINDSYKLANKHNIKATSINETNLRTRDKGYPATVMELTGEVPSQFQFYVTDSSKHFLRGALYFKTGVKNDSLAPVIEYIKYDIIQVLNSLEWKN